MQVCFDNRVSTWSDKILWFEVNVEDPDDDYTDDDDYFGEFCFALELMWGSDQWCWGCRSQPKNIQGPFLDALASLDLKLSLSGLLTFFRFPVNQANQANPANPANPANQANQANQAN